MTYTPQFGTDNRQAPQVSQHFPEYRPVAGYNPQFGKPALALPKASELSPLVRNALVGVGVFVVLLVLAHIAFTPAGMKRFWLGVGSELRWLTGSQQGNRLGSFVLFALLVVGIIGFARHKIIHTYGYTTFGSIELLSGVGLLGFAGFSWHLGHLGIWWALGIGFAGWVFAGWGWFNIKNDPGFSAPPPVQAVSETMVPSHDTHSAEWATPQEIHGIWDGRKSHSDEGTVWD